MTHATDTPPRTALAGRDLTLDLARVVCVILVVGIHLLFVGVGRRDDGGLVIERTAEHLPFFDVATWFLDIMPLFFVVGGYALRAGWRSAMARGESADRFIRVRLARLARPALPLFVFLTVALGGALALGVDPDLVDTIAIGVGSPLWFLAAYLLVQACAPCMMRLHERFGVRVPMVLLAASLLVDVVRLVLVAGILDIGPVPATGYGFGHELFGVPNVFAVWLFAQQVGFFLFDGWFARRSVAQLLALVLGGYGALGALVAVAGYPTSMLTNQWPPSAPLAVLAVVQAATLALLHRPLTMLMRTKAAQGVVLVVGSRLMTVYLWHLPVILLLTGLELLLPLPLPTPGSISWWSTRPLFLLAVLAVVWLASLRLVRFEVLPRIAALRFPSPVATVAAVVVFAAPILGITLYGLDPVLAATATAATAVALWLTGGRPA